MRSYSAFVGTFTNAESPIGRCGKIPCPAPGTQSDSLIEAPVGKHSEKPERFLEMIEAYYPNLPKIELNRRGPARDGWDAWGDEAAPDAWTEWDGVTNEWSKRFACVF
jgi:N6-adenosine-specific RNA methylase IME4